MLNSLTSIFTVAQENSGLGPMLILLFQLAFIILTIAGMWTTFTKAGKPGWACIVPIYNIIVMLQIAGKPIWWILLLFIPLVNLVIVIMVFVGMAENFGKGTLFGLGLTFFGFIFFPILGFGDAKYHQAPAH